MKKVLAIVLALLMTFGCFSVISFAEEATDHITEVPDGYVGVYTKDDLNNIRKNMSGKYILMNDIVFEDSDFEKGGNFYNKGKGWEPIGTSSGNFIGTFDGNGYTIKNLYINAPNQNYTGLFGSTIKAVIKNISLINANITGNSYVGGIVGYAAMTTIDYCNAQGMISGKVYIGGIAGYLYSSTNVKYCSNIANVNADSGVGGIAGFSSEGGEIVYCSNSGSITATGYEVGGIIGYVSTLTCKVLYCYNCGDVTASGYAGGIIGRNTNNPVKHCYSVGTITAKSNFGGCFGTKPGEVTFCYYLDETVVNPTCTSGTAKSAEQLRRISAYEKWDFNTTWTMEGREDYPYPELIDVPLVLPEDLHEHEYIAEVTTPATHLKTGVMTYACDCGDSYTETIDKLADHNYSSVAKDPTCTHRGYTTYTCECGDSYKADYVDATGHDFTDWVSVKDPDCTNSGEEYRYCLNCGDEETRFPEALGHSHKAVVTSPTCTEGGYTTYTCACGDSYVDDYVDAKGHTDGDWVVAKPATTTQTGTKTQSCSVCGELLKTETIPMLPAKVHSVSVSGVSLDYKSTGTIATVINADVGANYTVTYSSSNSSVASVDTNGKVTAGKTGSATITCTVADSYGNVMTDTCEVKVSYNWWQWIIVIVLFGWIWY